MDPALTSPLRSVSLVMRFPASAWICLFFLLAGCQPAEEPPSPAPADSSAAGNPAQAIQALVDEYVRAYFDMFPENALLSGAPDPDPARLSDHSLELLARWQVYLDGLAGQIWGQSKN